MRKQFGIGYLEKVLDEMDAKVRKSIEEKEKFLDENPRQKEAMRQAIAVDQGKLNATKALRVRIRNDTGLEMVHTKAPSDVRKEIKK
jgi:hypothetical protein